MDHHVKYPELVNLIRKNIALKYIARIAVAYIERVIFPRYFSTFFIFSFFFCLLFL